MNWFPWLQAVLSRRPGPSKKTCPTRRQNRYVPCLEALEDRLALSSSQIAAVAVGAGGIPQVRIYNAQTGDVLGDFSAFSTAF